MQKVFSKLLLIMEALKCKTLGAELAHPVEYQPSTFDDHLPMLNTRR